MVADCLHLKISVVADDLVSRLWYLSDETMKRLTSIVQLRFFGIPWKRAYDAVDEMKRLTDVANDVFLQRKLGAGNDRIGSPSSKCG